MSLSDTIVDSIKSSNEATFLNHFSLQKCSHQHASNDKKTDNSERNRPTTGPTPLETDINYLLDVPLAARADKFYDEENMDVQSALLNSMAPWKTNPNYFQTAHISSLALLKMSIHARSGGSIEVMGMLTGKIVKRGIVVMDVYPLPVEGTETRVNALSEGYEFMVDYLDSLKKTGRNENIVGWYHSHPGYGCWLSGIDVGTQSLNQRFQDPYLAVVIDPERTINNGKVEIGAFRTYPQEYVDKLNSNAKKSDGTATEDSLAPKTIAQNSKDIPAEKIKDFGLHSSHYYSLKVEIFRSELEDCVLKNLWNKYWVSQFIENEEKKEISDDKITQLIQTKLSELNKNIDNLKRSPFTKPLKKIQAQQNEQTLEKSSLLQTLTDNNPLSIITNSQLSPFTRNNFFSGIGSSLSGNIISTSPSIKQQQQEQRRKQDESDMGESDSEMNDANDGDEDGDEDVEINDSDSQIGDDEEDFVGGNLKFNQNPNDQYPVFQGFTNKIRSTFYNSSGGHPTRRALNYKREGPVRSVDTDTSSEFSKNDEGINRSSKDPLQNQAEAAAEAKEAEETLKIAGISSRELINLKLQEILFLNE